MISIFVSKGLLIIHLNELDNVYLVRISPIIFDINNNIIYDYTVRN